MNKTRLEKVNFACMVVYAAATVGVVQISFLLLLISLSSVLAVRPAFGQANASTDNAGVRLESRIAKEEADGDLKAAITVYQQIAGDLSAPRAVRAKALLRLARCDEKLGQQARQLYEQIVRDYADQPVAAQARSRLTALKQQESPAPPATMNARKIDWQSMGRMGPTDTDGERSVYRDADGSLYFSDPAGHTKRLVFKASAKDNVGWVPSRDFSLVALILPGKEKPESTTLAVVKTDGTGYRELIHEGMAGFYFCYTAWSWDNRFLVESIVPENGEGRIVVVSVADGHQRELAKVHYTAQRNSKAVISPDGQFVAFETFATVESRWQIFVIPIEGRDRQLVYEASPSGLAYLHPALVDWTRDGQDLLVSDTRGLSAGIFLLPMKHGEAVGTPRIIHQGEVLDGCTNSAGNLVFKDLPADSGTGASFFLTSLSADGHVGVWSRLKAEVGDVPSLPSFSIDGKEIVYVMRGDRLSDAVVYNISTGQERTLYSSKAFLACHYGNQSATVFCTEPMGNGQTNILSISASHDDVRRLRVVDGGLALWGLSQDDQTLYGYAKIDGPSGTIRQVMLKLDLGSGQTTELYEFEKADLISFASERFSRMFRISGDEILVRQIPGGDWRVVTSMKGVTLRDTFATTPNEKWVVYNYVDNVGTESLFRAPIEGGQPELLGDFPHHSEPSHLYFSPDGKQLLAEFPHKKPSYDLWVLSNFLPKR